MPKLLVVFDHRSDDIARLADAVADGARSVRFAEVDVRRLDGEASAGASRVRALDSADALATYDGIILGVSGDEAALRLFARTSSSLVNKVGSVFAPSDTGGDGRRELLWGALTPMADRGMILVPSPVTEVPDDALESARALGKRVADVVGWVTHARSHHHHH